MIQLFLLDILIYNTTPYNIPLIILSMPNLKSCKLPLIISLALSFIEWRYLFLSIIFLIIYYLNKLIKNNLNFNQFTYYILVVIDYIVFFITTDIFTYLT